MSHENPEVSESKPETELSDGKSEGRGFFSRLRGKMKDGNAI
jgi:hypothetical protein